MQRLVRTGAWLVLLGCSAGSPARPSRSLPGIVIPTTFGEGRPDAAPAPATSSRAPAPAASESASASAAAPPIPPPRATPPDPEPLRQSEQWEYELQIKDGNLSVLSTARRQFKTPIVTARRFGRFAIELWIGNELIDRVRFDFPGLALEQPTPSGGRRKLYAPPDLTRGADVRQKVLVPAAARARRAVLVDRASGNATLLPWPPDQPIEPLKAAPPEPAPAAEPAAAPQAP